MPDLAAQLAPLLMEDTLVTDAGSVKGPVVAKLEPILGNRFVGAHPIAGSDRSGFAAAQPDLFEGATCVLTPGEDTPASVLEFARLFWASVGCRILQMSPSAHDAALARTSHLPHAVAAALVNAISQHSTSDWRKLVGGGYRDSTRIAAGHPEMWTGILLANRQEVSTSIAEFIEILHNIRAALDASDADRLHSALSEAKKARDSFDAL